MSNINDTQLPPDLDLAAVSGKVHSIQSMGALDGPGLRYVIFLQGCNLRCGCCHNPDTWHAEEGTVYTAGDLYARASRFREYFKNTGGITLSGGEPLLQADFATAIFSLARAGGIHTCLDTSGSILNDKVKTLLSKTDRVLLDIKYTNDRQYRRHVGCSLDAPLAFLAYLDEQKIPVTLRQVIIPTLNDDEENIRALRAIADRHKTVDGIELLPFRKICAVKYERMAIPFPFADIPEPTQEKMRELNALLK